MTLPEFLTQDADGHIHVTGHRISLQDLVYYYNEGYSPEALLDVFPTLSLAIIHKVIAFYLEDQANVDAFVARCDAEMDRQRGRAAGARHSRTSTPSRGQAGDEDLTMPLRFVLDENQRGLLWRAVIRHNQAGIYPLDVVRVGDLPDLPLGSIDPDILLWCEREDRILVSFDKATLAGHLANQLQTGHHSPGIFMLRRASRLSQVVAHLALVAHASDAWEWQGRVEFIP